MAHSARERIGNLSVYDSVGNLTNVNHTASADIKLQYDWPDRLTNMADASRTNKYRYAAGNQLWTEDGPFASDTVTNTYQNRLRGRWLSSSRPDYGPTRSRSPG